MEGKKGGEAVVLSVLEEGDGWGWNKLVWNSCNIPDVALCAAWFSTSLMFLIGCCFLCIYEVCEPLCMRLTPPVLLGQLQKLSFVLILTLQCDVQDLCRDLLEWHHLWIHDGHFIEDRFIEDHVGKINYGVDRAWEGIWTGFGRIFGILTGFWAGLPVPLPTPCFTLCKGRVRAETAIFA